MKYAPLHHILISRVIFLPCPGKSGKFSDTKKKRSENKQNWVEEFLAKCEKEVAREVISSGKLNPEFHVLLKGMDCIILLLCASYRTLRLFVRFLFYLTFPVFLIRDENTAYVTCHAQMCLYFTGCSDATDPVLSQISENPLTTSFQAAADPQ